MFAPLLRPPLLPAGQWFYRPVDQDDVTLFFSKPDVIISHLLFFK